MRKICSSIMICMLMVLFAHAQKTTFVSADWFTDVIIIRDAPPSTKPRVPEKDPLAFNGYAVKSMNSLLLSSNKTVDADVHIENLTSGEYAEYAVSITSTQISLGIMGPGSYHLTISLSSGVTYSGDFDL